jgi:hypothetical protein
MSFFLGFAELRSGFCGFGFCLYFQASSCHTLSLSKSWVFFNEFSSLVLLNWEVDFVVLGLGFACR